MLAKSCGIDIILILSARYDFPTKATSFTARFRYFAVFGFHATYRRFQRERRHFSRRI